MSLSAGSVFGSAAKTGGRISLTTGYSSSSTSGGMNLKTANAGTLGASGGIVLSTGQAVNGIRFITTLVLLNLDAMLTFVSSLFQWRVVFWHWKR